MWHKIVLIGRLGRDPELRFTPAGKQVTSFNVAVDDGFGDNKKTIWLRVSAWDKLAETCNNHLKKGSLVLVEGRLTADPATGSPRIFKKQDGTEGASFEIAASAVRFLSSKGEPIDDAPVMASQEEIPF